MQPLIKTPFVLAAILSSAAVWAQSAGFNGGNQSPPQQGQAQHGPEFNQMKQKLLQHIQASIQILQIAQSCVNSATDHKALEQCRE